MKNTPEKSEPEFLRQKAEELLKNKSEAKIMELVEELAFQNQEKAKRADELIIANKELVFQNEEKAKRADELLIANKELVFQNEEKIKRAAELIVAKEEIAFQAELIIANNKALKLSHELEGKQIELETLNDELIAAQSSAVNAAKKYLELYDFAPTGYLSLSNLGKITEINLYGAKMLCKEPLFLQGSKFSFFVSNDTKPIFNHFFDKVFDSKVEESCEVTLFEINNPIRHVQLTGIVTEMGDQCLVTMVDITDYRLQQEKLQQSEQRYQALVEWSPYAALVHRDMIILYVNPAAVKLFGATSEQDLVGTPVMRWHHPDYHQIVRERIRRAAEEGLEAPMIESKYFKLDGTVMDLEVQGRPIIYNGFPSILATFNDVTERRRYEYQLGERLKEIQTLYYLSQLSQRQDLPLIALYQDLTDFLPKGWQYSEIACSRIVIDDVEFRSENFIDSAWKLSAPLLVNNAVKGLIEVAYLKEMPKEDEGPFLKEERELINTLAQQLGTITEQNYAEEEKARQTGLINSLLDSIPDIIFFKDTEGVYLGCNPPFADFVNKSREKIIGKTDYDLFDKEVAGFFRHNDIEMLKQKLPRHNEEWITYPDGRKILLDTVKTPYWSSDGKLIGILGISRDITERKEAENKVIESEDRFNMLAEHSRVITWEVDANGLYTYISDVCLAVLGYEPEEIIGKFYFYTFYPEQQREVLKVAALEFFARKEPFIGFKNALESKEKKIVWVSTNGMPMVDDNGQLTGYRGTDTDITGRRQMEEEIKLTNARLSMATHAGGVGVWDYDIVNNILLWDDEMIALYGLDKKNFHRCLRSLAGRSSS
jgi:PAS domain S-box-containing protein